MSQITKTEIRLFVLSIKNAEKIKENRVKLANAAKLKAIATILKEKFPTQE